MTRNDLIKLYEENTGKAWNADDGVMWLMENYEHLDIHTKIPVLSKTAHITLSDKASWLSQQPCLICNPSFPISIVPLRIRPESWQTISSIDKAAFKAALSNRLSTRNANIQKGRICLSFLFVCSTSRRTKDLDNMAKLLMDSIKDIVMGDDRNVDHLNLMRLTHEGSEEYVIFRLSASHLNNHDNIVLPEMRHSWAGAEPLNIEDFKLVI